MGSGGAVRLEQLAKSFGGVRVVHDIDLDIPAGEFFSLLGPSGCGKTTTLRMIAGFIDPSEGSIEMSDQMMSSPMASVPPERRNMAMIFQSYAIWPNMTVFENVAFGLRARRLPSEEIRRRTTELLSIVKLDQLGGRYPNELSGGQQQRVALARSIVIKPEVLLLDEPLSNLDANLREEMRGEIRRLHDEFNMTTIYVTHDQSEAMAISDRIAVMNQGKIDQLDAPVNIYRAPKTRFVAGFIGRTNFIEGRLNGDIVSFNGFEIARSRLGTSQVPPGSSTFSVRPQNMEVLATRPAEANQPGIAGKITSRTFLGETWDYVFDSDTGLRLRVVSPPAVALEINQPVWLRIDSAQIVRVEESPAAM
jgi:ABC-type Fe3+/spermidine/putrescine transport system ATPase subunit